MLETFHPVIGRWFARKFGEPSAPQLLGWPAIRAGTDTLIAAPTGSGKTLAAFLVCLDRLLRASEHGPLEDATEVVYVSPLKALGNDIRKNLEQPLAELAVEALAHGVAMPSIRVGVRSGDTTSSERAKLLKRPPHILVTTPESLYLLLTSDRGRKQLSKVRTVIVDEIHALARDKRGSHLALSLERLDALRAEHGEVRPTRIGLSATQRPIERIARFLVGVTGEAGVARPCTIVDAGDRRPMDLAIEIPGEERSAICSGEQWGALLNRVVELIESHHSTLLFVNTRRLVEKLTFQLEERLGAERVAAHHGSMSKEARFHAEDALKHGRIKAVVATASLEMGIDVGSVDLVCQVGSPRGIATALQRIGRSGHWKGATPKGRLFPTTRDELVECASLLLAIREGRLEETEIPVAPLDVLTQQVVAEVSSREWEEEALFATVRGAAPYAELPRPRFDEVVSMLSEGIAAGRGRAAAYLHRDAVNRKVTARRGARLAATLNGGAIPDIATYSVVAEPDGTSVGTLDEHFAVDSRVGDVFLLGNTSWRIRRIEGTTVRVEDAGGQPPNVPFWQGEAPGRSLELSAAVGRLRERIEPLLDAPDGAVAWLRSEVGIDAESAGQVTRYLAASKSALGALPTQTTLVAERFFDEGGGAQLVVHAPFGMRFNRAFGLALRKSFCRSFNFELQAAATDEGVLLSLGPQHSFPLESVFEFVAPGPLEETLTQAALTSPLFGVRWRWNATRSLAVLRHQGGRRVPPQILRMRSDDLLASVFPSAAACQEHQHGPIEVPDHPLVQDAVHDCLHEAMDYPRLKALMERVRRGELKLVARDTPEPSPLSHEIVHAHPYSFLDDAPAEERRTRAVVTRRTLGPAAGEMGALDAAAIEEVRSQVRPEPRGPEELHDLLLTFGLLPAEALAPGWEGWLEGLRASRRVVRLQREGRIAFAATERAALALRALGEEAHALDPIAQGFETYAGSTDDARLVVVRGWLEHAGPVTIPGLATRLGLPERAVLEAMLGLETQGWVMRGRFTPGLGTEEWCERNLLARIHRLTLNRLRREIEPVSIADLMRFLARWQHVQPGGQLAGSAGLMEVVAQLQGFQAPAAAWERDLLPARLRGYHPGWLDEACMTGRVVWGRFVPTRHEPEVVRTGARPPPSAAVPLGLALREELPWLLDREALADDALSEPARALRAVLQRRGASFWSELVGAAKRPAAEVEGALWELVAAGEVASDGFSGVRALVERTGGGVPGRAGDPLHGGGRWSLLRHALDLAPSEEESVARWAELLLKRYGVLVRDLLAREPGAPPWRELVRALRKKEARGELRGGRFVVGVGGEQFAAPSAVETLRALRRMPTIGAERVTVGAGDPLNLLGIVVPGARISSQSRTPLLFVDGIPRDAAPEVRRLA